MLKEFDEIFDSDLEDAEYSANLLHAALKYEDFDTFLTCLRDVVRVRGGMAYVAQASGVGRESLYKILSTKGNPSFQTVLSILGAVGLEINFAPTTVMPESAESEPGDTPSSPVVEFAEQKQRKRYRVQNLKRMWFDAPELKPGDHKQSLRGHTCYEVVAVLGPARTKGPDARWYKVKVVDPPAGVTPEPFEWRQ